MKKLLEFLNGKPVAEQAEFATDCKTTIGYMRKAIYAGQVFRARLCIAIEIRSAGAVRCEDLDPSADWAALRKSN